MSTAGSITLGAANAIESGLAVPRLAGIPRRVGAGDDTPERAAIALTLLDAGIAEPRLWAKHRSPEAFIAAAVREFCARAGGKVLDRRFGVGVRLDRAVDPWDTMYMGTGAPDDHRWFLCFEPVHYNVIHVGSLVEWLACWHPGLPAFVWSRFLCAQHAARFYTWDDAMEFEEMMFDGADEEWLKERIEEMGRAHRPRALEHHAMSERAVRIARRAWPVEVCRVVDAAIAVDAAQRAAVSRHALKYSDPVITEADMDAPFPALVVSESRGDATCAAFDDEFITNGEQLGRMPYEAWELKPGNVNHTAAVFAELASQIAVLRAAAEFIDAIPGKGKLEVGTLAQVLAADDMVLQFERIQREPRVLDPRLRAQVRGRARVRAA